MLSPTVDGLLLLYAAATGGHPVLPAHLPVSGIFDGLREGRVPRQGSHRVYLFLIFVFGGGGRVLKDSAADTDRSRACKSPRHFFLVRNLYFSLLFQFCKN